MTTLRALRLVASSTLILGGCTSLTSPPPPEPTASDTTTAATAPKASAAPAPTPAPTQGAPAAGDEQLVTEDTQVGTGATAKTGDTVSMHYVGKLTDGSEFDSSRKRNQPFTFTIGRGSVIRGWDQGIPGMKVGGKRKLTIPYSLAYGERGRPPTIPPKATLIFDVELVEIKAPQ